MKWVLYMNWWYPSFSLTFLGIACVNLTEFWSWILFVDTFELKIFFMLIFHANFDTVWPLLSSSWAWNILTPQLVCHSITKARLLNLSVHYCSWIHNMSHCSAGTNLQAVQPHDGSLSSEKWCRSWSPHCFFTHFSLLYVKVKAASKYVDVPVSETYLFVCVYTYYLLA